MFWVKEAKDSKTDQASLEFEVRSNCDSKSSCVKAGFSVGAKLCSVGRLVGDGVDLSVFIDGFAVGAADVGAGVGVGAGVADVGTAIGCIGDRVVGDLVGSTVARLGPDSVGCTDGLVPTNSPMGGESLSARHCSHPPPESRQIAPKQHSTTYLAWPQPPQPVDKKQMSELLTRKIRIRSPLRHLQYLRGMQVPTGNAPSSSQTILGCDWQLSHSSFVFPHQEPS